jgi:hypothetical protein
MNSNTLHFAGYFPPPPEGERPPVHVEITLVDEPDRDKPIPSWPWGITVSFTDGTTKGLSGHVEAMDHNEAQLRVYSNSIDLLAELLAAEKAAKSPPRPKTQYEADFAKAREFVNSLSFVRHVIAWTKHGPRGSGEPGPCDPSCVKCRAERELTAIAASKNHI